MIIYFEHNLHKQELFVFIRYYLEKNISKEQDIHNVKEDINGEVMSITN